MTIQLPEPAIPPTGIHDNEGLYTAAQMQAYGEAMRREAIEECAKLCEVLAVDASGFTEEEHAYSYAADKIKELLK